MKFFLSGLIFYLMLHSVSNAQNASQYFPASTGHTWYFEVTTLDSLNNPISGSSRFRRDNFQSIETYLGRTANIVHIRDFLSSPQQNGPITDTLRLSFENTNAFRYIDILGGLDSIPFINQIGIANFLNSLKGWYSIYRFASAVNTQYTIISRDTTISFDTLTIPLRFTSTGRRLSDQTINLVTGTYNTKRFVTTNTVSYLLLNIIPIPIVTFRDSTWHAEGEWVVKQTNPSSNVDLTVIGFPISFYIPGSLMTLTTPGTGITPVSNEIPDGYQLSQNYPNPFNPFTTINFKIPEPGKVKLSVYDMLGREVVTLLNENLSPGEYKYNFDASGMNSGSYIYRLEAENTLLTRKMLLVK